MDSTAPEVSVIVRSMARSTLDAALASIARQQGVRAEVVVVAASGPSHPPLAAMGGAHPMRLITASAPLKRAAAANAGLVAARGAWITFLDDDDLFLEDHLAGLVAATTNAPHARVVTSYAKGVFRDGHVEWFGQPFALKQLYERNFIHLSATLFARSLVDAGCRFDERFDILEDWEFMLQLAQRAAFHFVPLDSFQWNADAGDSGAAGGANHDAARFASHRDRVYAKWQAAYEALEARTQPLLERAAAALAAGRLADADKECRAVLVLSANDPWALNLRAQVLRVAGRVADARNVQALAAAVRPQDAGFVYNLALLDQALGDVEAARRNVRKALAVDPAFEPARALAHEVGVPLD